MLAASIRGAALGSLVALAVVGCASTPTPTPSAPALAGTAWTVTSVGGTDTLAAARPTMAFGVDGRIQGSGSCNGYGGPYRLDGDVIEIGELASTLMLCQDAAIGVQETAFMGALRGAQVWSIDDGGELHLGGVSEIVARPVGAEPSASGAGGIVGAWDLVELGRTADFAHLVPTIEFTADGSVSGFAACNTFRGTYTTDGSTLSVGPLATTKMACERPASAVEAEYLTALDAVTGWAIESDGRLRLEGPIQLRFAHH